MDYGKILKMQFDGRVHNVSSIEKTRYRIVNAYSEYIYPIDVTYGQNDHEVYLHFTDINNLVFPAYLECLQTIKMGSDYVSFEAFTMEIFLQNLLPVPRDFEYVALNSVDVTGEMIITFDGKVYYDETRYVEVSSVSVSGNSELVRFNEGYYDETKYISMSATVTVSGQYCDINGVPL